MNTSKTIRALATIAVCVLGALFFLGKAIALNHAANPLPSKAETSQAIEDIVSEAEVEPGVYDFDEDEPVADVAAGELSEELPEGIPPVPEPPTLPPAE